MAKRKLGASVIILCIAALTLITGTYAWFLSGGAANLFDIGFDVIKSEGSVLLQGDRGTANGGKTDNGGWGTKLEREDFETLDFIVEQGGFFKPVSGSNFTASSANFIGVGLSGQGFEAYEVPSKNTAGVNATDICYNDFTFKVKSGGDEIPGNDTSGAWMRVDFIGREDANTETAAGQPNAANAARVAVTINGSTTVYSTDGEAYEAVTTKFDGQIEDTKDDRIITSDDNDYSKAGLAAPSSYKSLGTSENLTKIVLGNIKSSDADATVVNVRIWLEGNDKDCVDFPDRSIASKNLLTKIDFGIQQ